MYPNDQQQQQQQQHRVRPPTPPQQPPSATPNVQQQRPTPSHAPPAPQPPYAFPAGASSMFATPATPFLLQPSTIQLPQQHAAMAAPAARPGGVAPFFPFTSPHPASVGSTTPPTPFTLTIPGTSALVMGGGTTAGSNAAAAAAPPAYVIVVPVPSNMFPASVSQPHQFLGQAFPMGLVGAPTVAAAETAWGFPTSAAPGGVAPQPQQPSDVATSPPTTESSAIRNAPLTAAHSPTLFTGTHTAASVASPDALGQPKPPQSMLPHPVASFGGISSGSPASLDTVHTPPQQFQPWQGVPTTTLAAPMTLYAATQPTQFGFPATGGTSLALATDGLARHPGPATVSLLELLNSFPGDAAAPPSLPQSHEAPAPVADEEEGVKHDEDGGKRTMSPAETELEAAARHFGRVLEADWAAASAGDKRKRGDGSEEEGEGEEEAEEEEPRRKRGREAGARRGRRGGKAVSASGSEDSDTGTPATTGPASRTASPRAGASQRPFKLHGCGTALIPITTAAAAATAASLKESLGPDEMIKRTGAVAKVRYRCSECQKPFARRSHFLAHKATHSDRRDHACSECPA
ncbi:hypothetical protein HDU96_001519, partial [Phlyctochytrium bullatum]